MNYTTKAGIEVKPGQIWRDRDKRVGERLLRVIRLDGGFVYCKRCTQNGLAHGHETRLSPQRMHAHSTGFDLVKTLPLT